MAKNIMGTKPGDPEMEKIRREYATFIKGVVSPPINFPGTPYWKALKSRAAILCMFENMLNQRMKEISKREELKEEEDMLGWCLIESKLSKEQILDLLLSMLFAGHETTTVAISLTIFFLAGCPKADEHLEIAKRKKERGDITLSWEDYKQMEFTQCVSH
ncbi:hypothetical protein LUZ60_014371 [Juncus effusus]|nr:hypothetical protein LUZ60_014371 [Juncus effusus]